MPARSKLSTKGPFLNSSDRHPFDTEHAGPPGSPKRATVSRPKRKGPPGIRDSASAHLTTPPASRIANLPTCTSRRQTSAVPTKSLKSASTSHHDVKQHEYAAESTGRSACADPRAAAAATSGPAVVPVKYPTIGPSPRMLFSLVNVASLNSISVISSALQAFFNDLKIPLHHLAPIFVENGFDTDATLDFLCELPVVGHWDDMKKDIITKGKLVGWLAIQKGLEQRAASLHAT